jgi:WD40 repeat protein
MRRSEPKSTCSLAAALLLISLLTLSGCRPESPPPTPRATATITTTPTRTPRPSPTITPTPSATPTPTLPPYPAVITPDNLAQLSPLYRFNSLGFYLPGSDWLVLYDNQQTAVWDLRSGSVVSTFIGRYKAIAGDYALTGTGEDLLLWRVSTGEQLHDFSAENGQFHPAQPWLVVYGGEEAHALLWDCQHDRLLGQVYQSPGDAFVFSPDGHRLAASGGTELGTRVWSLPDLALTNRLNPSLSTEGGSTRVAFSADGRYLFLSGGREHRVYDLEAGEIVWSDSHAWAVYPGPAAEYALVTRYATTHILDLERAEFLDDYLLGDTPTVFLELDLISNHDAAEAGYREYIYRASGFSQLATLTLRQGIASSGSFHPGGGLFAIPDLDGALHFFDTETWEPRSALAGMEGFYIVRPEFSREGHWLMFGWYTYDEFGDYYNGFDVWGIP